MPEPATAHPDPGSLILVVVGAHLRAEMHDRPLAARLCEAIMQWQAGQPGDAGLEPLTPLTCSDLWMVNDPALRGRPVIAIGAPDVNAATAWLGNRLPTAFVLDGRFRIHLDPELVDEQACLWGVDADATAEALDVFTDRYLDGYLRRAHGLTSRSSSRAPRAVRGPG